MDSLWPNRGRNDRQPTRLALLRVALILVAVSVSVLLRPVDAAPMAVSCPYLPTSFDDATAQLTVAGCSGSVVVMRDCRADTVRVMDPSSAVLLFENCVINQLELAVSVAGNNLTSVNLTVRHSSFPAVPVVTVDGVPTMYGLLSWPSTHLHDSTVLIDNCTAAATVDNADGALIVASPDPAVPNFFVGGTLHVRNMRGNLTKDNSFGGSVQLGFFQPALVNASLLVTGGEYYFESVNPGQTSSMTIFFDSVEAWGGSSVLFANTTASVHADQCTIQLAPPARHDATVVYDGGSYTSFVKSNGWLWKTDNVAPSLVVRNLVARLVPIAGGSLLQFAPFHMGYDTVAVYNSTITVAADPAFLPLALGVFVTGPWTSFDLHGSSIVVQQSAGNTGAALFVRATAVYVNITISSSTAAVRMMTHTGASGSEMKFMHDMANSQTLVRIVDRSTITFTHRANAIIRHIKFWTLMEPLVVEDSTVILNIDGPGSVGFVNQLVSLTTPLTHTIARSNITIVSGTGYTLSGCDMVKIEGHTNFGNVDITANLQGSQFDVQCNHGMPVAALHVTRSSANPGNALRLQFNASGARFRASCHLSATAVLWEVPIAASVSVLTLDAATLQSECNVGASCFAGGLRLHSIAAGSELVLSRTRIETPHSESTAVALLVDDVISDSRLSLSGVVAPQFATKAAVVAAIVVGSGGIVSLGNASVLRAIASAAAGTATALQVSVQGDQGRVTIDSSELLSAVNNPSPDTAATARTISLTNSVSNATFDVRHSSVGAFIGGRTFGRPTVNGAADAFFVKLLEPIATIGSSIRLVDSTVTVAGSTARGFSFVQLGAGGETPGSLLKSVISLVRATVTVEGFASAAGIRVGAMNASAMLLSNSTFAISLPNPASVEAASNTSILPTFINGITTMALSASTVTLTNHSTLRVDGVTNVGNPNALLIGDTAFNSTVAIEDFSVVNVGGCRERSTSDMNGRSLSAVAFAGSMTHSRFALASRAELSVDCRYTALPTPSSTNNRALFISTLAFFSNTARCENCEIALGDSTLRVDVASDNYTMQVALWLPSSAAAPTTRPIGAPTSATGAAAAKNASVVVYRTSLMVTYHSHANGAVVPTGGTRLLGTGALQSGATFNVSHSKLVVASAGNNVDIQGGGVFLFRIAGSAASADPNTNLDVFFDDNRVDLSGLSLPVVALLSLAGAGGHPSAVGLNMTVQRNTIHVDLGVRRVVAIPESVGPATIAFAGNRISSSAPGALTVVPSWVSGYAYSVTAVGAVGLSSVCDQVNGRGVTVVAQLIDPANIVGPVTGDIVPCTRTMSATHSSTGSTATVSVRGSQTASMVALPSSVSKSSTLSLTKASATVSKGSATRSIGTVTASASLPATYTATATPSSSVSPSGPTATVSWSASAAPSSTLPLTPTVSATLSAATGSMSESRRTSSPTASPPASATVTKELPPPLPPKAAIVAIAVTTVTATTAVSSAIGSPVTAVQASRANFIVNLQSCSVDLDEELEAMTNPTTMSIGASPVRYYLGAAVGNPAVVVGSFAVGGVLAVLRLLSLKRRFAVQQASSPGPLLRPLQQPPPTVTTSDSSFTRSRRRSTIGPASAPSISTSSFFQGENDGRDAMRPPRFRSALCWARCPSFQMFPLLFLLQPTASSAVTVIRFAEGPTASSDRTLAAFSIAVSSISVAAAMVAVTLQRGRMARFVTKRPKKRAVKQTTVQRLISFLVHEDGEWVDKLGCEGYCRQFGAFFDEFVGNAGWFMAVEMLFSFALGLLEPIATGAGCFPVAIITVVVYTIYVVLLFALRPHAARLNFAFALAMASIQLLAGIVVCAVTYTQARQEQSRMAIDYMSSLGMFLAVVKTVYDIGQMAYRVGWRRYVNPAAADDDDDEEGEQDGEMASSPNTGAESGWRSNGGAVRNLALELQADDVAALERAEAEPSAEELALRRREIAAQRRRAQLDTMSLGLGSNGHGADGEDDTGEDLASVLGSSFAAAGSFARRAAANQPPPRARTISAFDIGTAGAISNGSFNAAISVTGDEDDEDDSAPRLGGDLLMGFGAMSAAAPPQSLLLAGAGLPSSGSRARTSTQQAAQLQAALAAVLGSRVHAQGDFTSAEPAAPAPRRRPVDDDDDLDALLGRSPAQPPAAAPPVRQPLTLDADDDEGLDDLL